MYLDIELGHSRGAIRDLHPTLAQSTSPTDLGLNIPIIFSPPLGISPAISSSGLANFSTILLAEFRSAAHGPGDFGFAVEEGQTLRDQTLLLRVSASDLWACRASYLAIQSKSVTSTDLNYAKPHAGRRVD